MSDTDGRSWEPRLRELLNGIFSRRLDPLASELNALQGTLDGLRARLADEARAAEKEALEVFATEARVQLQASEKDFAGEREVLRGRYELSFKTERALLNAVIANIDRQRTQAGVLAATILGASTFATRVALFVVRSGNIVGWRGAGFGQETDEASLALLSVPLAEHSLVADAINRRQSVLTNNSADPGDLAFLGALRLNGATSAAIPLIVRDKPAAVLYADSTREDGIDVQPLEAIVRVASLAIELLPLRRSIEHFTTELPAPRVLTSSLDVSGPGDEIADLPSEVTAATTHHSLSVAQLPSSSDSATEPPEESSSTTDIEGNGHVATDVSVDDQPPVPTVASESAVDEAHSAVREAHEVAVPTEPPVDPAGSTDPRAHVDARRYARFLIGQIRLYQPARVAEGCRRGDLYDRLRDEIERSRKVYERHVPQPIRSEFDYFYQELVMNLAEGEATRLGRNFPPHQID